MNNQKRAGALLALIALCALIAYLNVGAGTPVINWPVEAYLGLAFTIGWLSSASMWLSYALAVVFIVLYIAFFYKLGSWIYALIAGR